MRILLHGNTLNLCLLWNQWLNWKNLNKKTIFNMHLKVCSLLWTHVLFLIFRRCFVVWPQCFSNKHNQFLSFENYFDNEFIFTFDIASVTQKRICGSCGHITVSVYYQWFRHSSLYFKSNDFFVFIICFKTCFLLPLKWRFIFAYLEFSIKGKEIALILKCCKILKC